MTLVQKDIYRRTDVGTVGWDDELDAVLLRWHGFATSESFRAHMRLCIELLEATGANKMYADARDQGAISDEDKLWSITEWATQADEAGLDYLVIVYPESVIAKMSVDSVIEQVDDDIERKITDDVTEGRTWLGEQPATATDIAVSELEAPTLNVEPSPDHDGEDTVGRVSDDAPTADDSTASPGTASATADGTKTETKEDAVTVESETPDREAATSSETPAATESDDSASTALDPPTMASIGGIVTLLGLGVAIVTTGQFPTLVSNELANSGLVFGAVVLVGMALGWGGAKATA